MAKVGVVTSQMFAENAYILWHEERSDCIVVDPGLDVDEILDFLTQRRLTPAAILNTHGHADHIAGNEGLKRQWPNCPLVIGAKERNKLIDPQANLSAPFGFSIISPDADQVVAEGDVVTFAGFELEVFETPGHSSGHVIFVWKNYSPWIALVGDVLMRRSVGRTDFADGNWDQLVDSIQTKLFCLPDDTVVLSGHGEPTTIGEEKEENPFVGRHAVL